jgi:hypothetical protein
MVEKPPHPVLPAATLVVAFQLAWWGTALLARAQEPLRALVPWDLGALLAAWLVSGGGAAGRSRLAARFFAHAGLEGFAKIEDIWSGAMLGRTVAVRVWRVPRAEVPEDEEGRVRILYKQWARVDAHIASTTAGGTA